jgi:hypothetical protein
MARGYLGKISAIVSANTGDYVRKLNESAASTKRFAQSIQRDLSRASAEATKSVTGILTPLQRVERALQNAGSQRLRFRGFDGAIRTVEDLSKRLAGLDDDRQIDLVVRTSGLDSVNRVKQVIGDLSEEEIDLAINVGGVNGLERLRSQIQEVNGTPVNVQTGVSAARLDELIAKFRVLAPERIRQIQFAVETAQFEKAATALQRTISFSEAVTKSFQQSAQAVSQLPADVQVAFGPAFKQITDELLAFGEQIENIDPGTQAFNTIAENAKRAEQAIARLVEVQKLVSSGASGEELGFVDPRLRDTLGGSARLRSQAEGSRDPSQFRADVQQLKALDDLASSYFAKLEAGRQAAARGEDAGFDVADVERKLEGVLETSRRTQAELERKLSLELDAAEAEKTLQRIRDLVPGLRDDIALRITGDFQNLEQAETAAKSLVAQIKELDAAQLSAFGSQIDSLFAAIDSGDIKQIDAAVKELKATIGTEPLELKIDIDAQDLQGNAIDLAQKIQADFDRIVQSLPAGSLPRQRVDAAATGGPPGAPPSADLVGFAQAEADRFKELGAAIDDPTRRIDVLKSSITSLKGQLDQLPAPVRGQFVAALEEAEQEFLRLKGSATATAEEIERASQKVSELRASASRISSIALTAGSGDAISGIASQEAVGKLQAAQRLLAQVGATAGGPVAQAYDRLREAQLRFVQEGIQNTPRARREIELLERELARAAAQTGKIRMGQAFREIQRGGDIASKSLQRFSLAANQAAFIVDDFFSTTGGAEQKLRAIQNNITQLGFVLASTQGLFIGLGIALAGQLVIAITKYITKADEADRRTKALNESLASQKNLVEQLARAYEGLAKSIESVGASERGRAAIENLSVANDQRRQEREAGRAAIGATSPVVSGRQGEIAKLREELEKEQDLVKREILQRAVRSLEGFNEQLVREIEAAAKQLQRQVLRNVGGDPVRASTALDEAEAGVVQRLAAASRRGDRQGVDRLSRELAALRVAIISQRGEAQRSIIFGDRNRIGLQEDLSSLARAQQLTGGEGLTATTADIAQKRINRLFDQFNAGDITLPQLQNDLLNLRNSFGVVFEQVAEQLSAFTDALGRAVTELNKTVESELAQRGDSLRREANQAEARFGADAPQTLFARESQDRVEQARRQARDRRLDVDSEVSQLRQRFEAEAAKDAVEARRADRAPATEAGRVAARIAEAQARLAQAQLGPDATADEVRKEVRERDQARQTIERGRAQLADLFDALPQAQELRRRADEGDIAAQRELQDIERRRQSFERGAELAKSPAQKAAEDIEKSFADLNEFFDQRADAVLDRSGGLPDDAAREELRRIEEERRKSTEQLREQALRQTAPLAFQFADEIANAVLQGPSRAALGATDASTTQGQAELNRLIRGQDSARDVNLVELEKQTQALQEIKDRLPLPVAGA